MSSAYLWVMGRPRVHNKGKENEYTDWLHAFVNLAFLFPGGLQLPIYIYALKAEQLQGKEASSDENHKQECELQAAHEILPIIKEKFPKLPVTFLADSLYANEPLLKLRVGRDSDGNGQNDH